LIADVHSPIVCLLAGEDIDIDAAFPSSIPSPRRRAQIVAENPVSCAR